VVRCVGSSLHYCLIIISFIDTNAYSHIRLVGSLSKIPFYPSISLSPFTSHPSFYLPSSISLHFSLIHPSPSLHLSSLRQTYITHYRCCKQCSGSLMITSPLSLTRWMQMCCVPSSMITTGRCMTLLCPVVLVMWCMYVYVHVYVCMHLIMLH